MTPSMREYGYSIVKVLISDIVPDQKVKAAMNDINAAQPGKGSYSFAGGDE